MNAERWRVIETVFQGALEIAPARRARFVEERCDDAETRREVMALLDAASSDDTFIERPATASILEDSLAGTTVGRFRILHLLGEGGMGSVYLAERHDGAFEQRVALKLLRGGGKPLLRRFEREREVLAKLEHPNIARLIDGGVMPDGQAYLVLEHVDGEPLDRYAARHDLPIRARLGLILQLCDAIAFTHQNLVIHRDLKPSNILVDADGRVRVIDFGIALPAYLGDAATMHTSAERVLGTLSYMSPEQCERGAGAPVDVRADVYAIGAVAYKLLTGSAPIDVSEVGVVQAIADLTQRTPARPSTHDARLRGDLDTIILKALEKDPARRYQSVGELAEDLRRHLAHRPILARPPSARYALGKFVRRHRGQLLSSATTGATAGIVVALALLWFVVLPRMAARALYEARVELLGPQVQATLYTGVFWRGSDENVARAVPENFAVLVRARPHYERAVRFGLRDDTARREYNALRGAAVLHSVEWEAWEEHWPEDVPDGVRDIVLADDPAGAIEDARPEDLRDAGIILMLSGNINHAVKVLRRYEALVTADPVVEGLMGELYLALDRPELAYPRVRAAYEEFGDSRMTMLALAEAAVGVGDLSRAKMLIDEAEALPDVKSKSRFTRIRALYLAASGQTAEAVDAFAWASALRTKNGQDFWLNPIAFYQSARLARDDGRLQDAVRLSLWSCHFDGRLLSDSQTAAAALELFVELMDEWVGATPREEIVEWACRSDGVWLGGFTMTGRFATVPNNPRDWLRAYGWAREMLLTRPARIAVLPGDAERIAEEREGLARPNAVTDLAELLDVDNDALWEAAAGADDAARSALVNAWVAGDRPGARAAAAALLSQP